MNSFTLRTSYLPGPIILSAKAYRPTQDVIRSLTTMIEQGAPGFRPGEPFPSQVKLADRLGTSRPTLRKALGQLTDDRMIYWRVNDAIVEPAAPAIARLGGRPPAHIKGSTPPVTVEGILHLRCYFEGEAARRAADLARTSGKLRSALEKAFGGIVTAVASKDGPASLQGDRRFHWLIFDASPNNNPSRMFDRAHDYFLDVLAMELAKLWDDGGFRQEALRLNQELLHRIMRCEPEAARAAAHRYVDYLGQKYRQGRRST